MITESTRTVGIISAILSASGVDTPDHRPVSKFRSFVSRDLSEEGPNASSRRGIFELQCVSAQPRGTSKLRPKSVSAYSTLFAIDRIQLRNRFIVAVSTP